MIPLGLFLMDCHNVAQSHHGNGNGSCTNAHHIKRVIDHFDHLLPIIKEEKYTKNKGPKSIDPLLDDYTLSSLSSSSKLIGFLFLHLLAIVGSISLIITSLPVL